MAYFVLSLNEEDSLNKFLSPDPVPNPDHLRRGQRQAYITSCVKKSIRAIVFELCVWTDIHTDRLKCITLALWRLSGSEGNYNLHVWYTFGMVYCSGDAAPCCTLHISNICKSCFYHIRDLRRIRRHIPLSTAKTISNALISSRLDYCNSLINNIAKQDLSKLQRVQNCLARVILRAPRFSPSLPLLKQLHWLPVNYRIKFKLCTLTFRALAIHQPPYLASLLHFSNIPRQLRSSTSQQLSIPRAKLNLGKRAFSVAAPIIWNEITNHIKILWKSCLFS